MIRKFNSHMGKIESQTAMRTRINYALHNTVKMTVDAWKNQGAKVFANCKAIVANSMNGSWNPDLCDMQGWLCFNTNPRDFRFGVTYIN